MAHPAPLLYLLRGLTSIVAHAAPLSYWLRGLTCKVRSVTGALCDIRGNSYSVLERCRRVLWPHATVTASGGVAGAFCGLKGNSYSAQERCRSVLWQQRQQLQRLGALQERSVVSEATVTASRSVAGAFCVCRGNSYTL